MLRFSPDPRTSSPREISARELDLIAAAQRGDISAFNQLVRAHQELAYRLAFHLLDDATAAEGVTQRAFASAYRQIKHWKGDAFKIWLLKIVTQQCKRAPNVRARVENFGTALPIEMGLAVLNWDERVICVLADMFGLNDNDISQIINASVNTIRATRSRARRQIRDVLQINHVVLRRDALLAKR